MLGVEDSLFTTAISRIWLVGLIIFALTPFLIAARPQPQDAQAEAQVEDTQPVPESAGKTTDTRVPSSEISKDAPLATGN